MNLPLCALLASCADEDFAMLGAVATGAAANYARANGETATAASLLDTQQQIMNEKEDTAATPVSGRPGYVFSPQNGKVVDVKGIAAGAPVEDPTAIGSRFRVPQNYAISQQANSSPFTGSGISGTWSNTKLTWKFGADGSATLTVPSVNSNGVATTYMTYKADPDTGVFACTICRATLTGTLNCNGQSDYDMAVNKSYTEKYTLNGNTLTIGTEVMNRSRVIYTVEL